VSIESPGTIALERSWGPTMTGSRSTMFFAYDAVRLFEASTDDGGTTWVSARAGSAAAERLEVLEIAPESDVPVRHPLTMGSAPKVEVSARGPRVYAAWMQGQTLSLASVIGGDTQTFLLPEPAQLVDLAVGVNTEVVGLEFSDNRTVLLIRTGTVSSFRKLNSAFRFHPLAAHVGTKLSLIGQCLGPDGGVGGVSAGCTGVTNNPVLVFNTAPGGSAW
jgi:hypothetical protein